MRTQYWWVNIPSPPSLRKQFASIHLFIKLGFSFIYLYSIKPFYEVFWSFLCVIKTFGKFIQKTAYLYRKAEINFCWLMFTLQEHISKFCNSKSLAGIHSCGTKKRLTLLAVTFSWNTFKGNFPTDRKFHWVQPEKFM